MKEVPCPACRRLTTIEGNPFRPFCSERCKLHDLGNWALERYRVAGEPLDDLESDRAVPDGDDKE